MAARVLNFEPHKALFVPDADAMLFYKKIAGFSKAHLQSEGVVYVEINQQLGKETADVFREAGFTNIELKKDMSGNDRLMRVGR
jgi:release factor glutamine methyltransferase